MTAIEGFVTRHPVRSYFALSFAVSWAASCSSSALAGSRPPLTTS
jgi:hypothetical protein